MTFRHRVKRLLPLAALTSLVATAPAAAAEPVTSDNVKFLKNIPYQLRWEATTQEGTDIEFATMTVPTPATAAPPPPTPAAPARPKKSRRKSSRSSKRYRACVKKARKVKNKRKRSRAKRACKRYKPRKARARRSLADVDPAQPGVQRTYAFAGSYTNGLQIIDVSEPMNPVQVGHYDCGISQGDVQVFQRPDLGGRWFVAYASDDGYAFQSDSKCFVDADRMGYDASGKDGDGTFIADVTDPTKPETVSFVYYEKGSHNQTVHPSGKYLYNSNSDLVTDPTPGIEITDITDPKAPKDVTTLDIVPLPGLGSNSHDITFSADGKRAYSAAVSQTLILDTEDPANPSIIGRIFDPTVNVSHQAEAITATVPGVGERTVLIVSDEFAGATGTRQCPSGGGHVYDITGANESAPVKLGYYNITELRPTADPPADTCTSHVWQIHHEEKLMLQGWYNAGFRVFDLNEVAGLAFGGDGTGIKELAFGRFPEGSVWSAKSQKVSRDAPFAVYSNDQVRGFDAWEVNLAAPAKRRSSAIKWYPAGQEPTAGRSLGAAAFVCRLGT